MNEVSVWKFDVMGSFGWNWLEDRIKIHLAHFEQEIRANESQKVKGACPARLCDGGYGCRHEYEK